MIRAKHGPAPALWNNHNTRAPACMPPHPRTSPAPCKALAWPVLAVVLGAACGTTRAQAAPEPPAAPLAQAQPRTPMTPAPSPLPLEEERLLLVQLSSDHSFGKYGTAYSFIEHISTATVSYETDSYGFSLALPYLMLTGPQGTLRRRLGKPPLLETRIVHQTGLGDLSASVVRHLSLDEEDDHTLDLQASVKFHTASQAKGLGTGVNDYALSATLAGYNGPWSYSLTGGYAFLGSPGTVLIQGLKETIVLNNTASLALDGSYRVSDKLTLGASFSVEQAAAAAASAPRELNLHLRWRLASKLSFQFYLSKGLSYASPATGLGISLAAGF